MRSRFSFGFVVALFTAITLSNTLPAQIPQRDGALGPQFQLPPPPKQPEQRVDPQLIKWLLRILFLVVPAAVAAVLAALFKKGASATAKQVLAELQNRSSPEVTRRTKETILTNRLSEEELMDRLGAPAFIFKPSCENITGI
jgi:hypothetical protein